jgi:hypothetical protein
MSKTSGSSAALATLQQGQILSHVVFTLFPRISASVIRSFQAPVRIRLGKVSFGRVTIGAVFRASAPYPGKGPNKKTMIEENSARKENLQSADDQFLAFPPEILCPEILGHFPAQSWSRPRATPGGGQSTPCSLSPFTWRLLRPSFGSGLWCFRRDRMYSR